MGRILVAVLMGGKSAEREVSLSTGRQVMAALDPERYEVFSVDTAYLTRPANGEPPLVGRNRPDVAVICLHGRFGEDGTVQGMLELLEIPYTGSGVLSSALAIDKVMSKKVLALEGIPVPADVTLHGRREGAEYLSAFHAGTAKVLYPSVVKPSTLGSTIGITIVRERDQMAAALDTAFHYDEAVLVEKFIDGMEITGPVLGNDDLRPLPLIEIVPNGGFYDYEAKYTPGATDEIVPARLPAELTRQAQELAVRSHRALGCRGFSRTDMLVGEDGIYVLEVNTIPGMTPTSLLPRSAEAAGIPFDQLVDRMVQLALEGRSVESTPAAAA